MGWLIVFAGLIAYATCPQGQETTGAASARAMAMIWFAWALVVIAMIAGLVIVEVQP